MQSRVRENIASVDSSAVKLVAKFCPEGCFGTKKSHRFSHLKT